MLEDIEDTLCDLKDSLETGGGLVLAVLIFAGVIGYFMFVIDPATTLMILALVFVFFAAIFFYRIVSFFTGD